MSKIIATNNMEVLTRAMKEIDQAEKKAGQLAKKTFPLNSTVFWRYGNHVRTGIVIDHKTFHDPELRVRGATGKDYWISAHSVLSEMLPDFDKKLYGR